MDWTSLLLLSLALCFDSVAVSTIVGMCCNKVDTYIARLVRFCLILAIMQGLMPLIGWAAAYNFRTLIEKWDHWVAFILLTAIGGKMIADYIKTEDKKDECPLLKQYTSLTNSILLGLATSIDALIVGVTLALVDLNFVTSLPQFQNMCIGSITIAMITFICSISGAVFGKMGGKGLSQKSSLVGGAILILIGIKILIEHIYLP